jgi:hypothetical protein
MLRHISPLTSRNTSRFNLKLYFHPFTSIHLNSNMLYQTLTCLSTLIALSTAIPQTSSVPPPTSSLPPRPDIINRVTPVVKLSGSPLNGKVINAAYGGFFIGRATTIGPCADFAGCDTYSNITAINFNQDKASGTLVHLPSPFLPFIFLTIIP